MRNNQLIWVAITATVLILTVSNAQSYSVDNQIVQNQGQRIQQQPGSLNSTFPTSPNLQYTAMNNMPMQAPVAVQSKVTARPASAKTNVAQVLVDNRTIQQQAPSKSAKKKKVSKSTNRQQPVNPIAQYPQTYPGYDYNYGYGYTAAPTGYYQNSAGNYYGNAYQPSRGNYQGGYASGGSSSAKVCLPGRS